MSGKRNYLILTWKTANMAFKKLSKLVRGASWRSLNLWIKTWFVRSCQSKMLLAATLRYHINETRNPFNLNTAFLNYNISCCFRYLKFRPKEPSLLGRLFALVTIAGQRENEYCERIRSFWSLFQIGFQCTSSYPLDPLVSIVRKDSGLSQFRQLSYQLGYQRRFICKWRPRYCQD